MSENGGGEDRPFVRPKKNPVSAKNGGFCCPNYAEEVYNFIKIFMIYDQTISGALLTGQLWVFFLKR